MNINSPETPAGSRRRFWATAIIAHLIIARFLLVPQTTAGQEGNAKTNQASGNDRELVRLRSDFEKKVAEFTNNIAPFEQPLENLPNLPPFEKLKQFANYVQAATPLYEAGKMLVDKQPEIQKMLLNLGTAQARIADYYRAAAEISEKDFKTILDDKDLKADDKQRLGERVSGLTDVYRKLEKKWRAGEEITSKFITADETKYQFKLLGYEVELLGQTIELSKKMEGEASGPDFYNKLLEFHQHFRRALDAFEKHQRQLLEQMTTRVD